MHWQKSWRFLVGSVLSLASMSPQSHERVFTLRLGAPLPLLCSVNLSAACHVAVPPRCLTEGTHALCRCLIIVFQRHAGYCQTIHSIFCSASIGHFPRVPLFQLFFLLLCNVPVRAYRRTSDNRAELSDRVNCGMICVYSFWLLATGMSRSLQPFVTTGFSLGIADYTYSEHLCWL